MNQGNIKEIGKNTTKTGVSRNLTTNVHLHVNYAVVVKWVQQSSIAIPLKNSKGSSQFSALPHLIILIQCHCCAANHKVRLRTDEWTVMTNHLINIYHSSVQATNLSRFLSRQKEEIQTGWYVLLILVKELVDGLIQINSHNNGLLHKALLYLRLAAIFF